MRRLPSLTALRSFEAVARTLSFTRAAADLGVTQAAVSRQVKALETALAVRLVERSAAGNRLSEAGEVLYASLHRAFADIERTAERIAGSGRRQVLNVSVAPFFSARWLTPRLTGFYRRHPAIELRLHHAYEPTDFRHALIDLGINWCRPGLPGVAQEVVLTGDLVPVLSPQLARRLRPRSPAALAAAPLLYEFELADWEAWFAAVGTRLPEAAETIRLNDSHALLRAAVDGHGVGLFFRGLVQEELRAGRLLQPFPTAIHRGFDYRLTWDESRELPAKAKAFRRWLGEEIARAPLA
ncbi:MAG TPA: LysR substrate-binding domain-containing protein [Kiloniellales bacterium]|nr:LysR substrate-binding domain-containing protein [Kiloniellales bacterium]